MLNAMRACEVLIGLSAVRVLQVAEPLSAGLRSPWRPESAHSRVRSVASGRR